MSTDLRARIIQLTYPCAWNRDRNDLIVMASRSLLAEIWRQMRLDLLETDLDTLPVLSWESNFPEDSSHSIDTMLVVWG